MNNVGANLLALGEAPMGKFWAQFKKDGTGYNMSAAQTKEYEKLRKQVNDIERPSLLKGESEFKEENKNFLASYDKKHKALEDEFYKIRIAFFL